VRIRAALGLDAERPLLVYLGSLSGNYMLDEMLDFFLALRERKPDAAFLFITRDDAERIRSAAAKKGIGPEALLIRPASREEVPDLIAAADLGVAFKRPTFSALACSPTKLGEMLAIGIPVAANAGVGDVAAVLAKSTAGSLVDRFDHPSLLRAVDATLALGSSRERIREISYQRFALKGGIDRYDAIYRSLSAGRTPFPPLRSVSDPATRSGAPRAF
jgi:glycosyltransferase involved in cell wall biosynthesis